MKNSITPRNTNVKLSKFDIENLPNHRKKSQKEWSSACPQCGMGVDRFIFTVDKGAFWCRVCEFGGYVDKAAPSPLTDVQRADIEREKRLDRQTEIDRKRTALERLQAKRNDVIYHRNLNGKTGYVNRKWGLSDDTIDLFQVGYCHACPTSPYSDSITIPYYWAGNLINLRHRLSSPNGEGKYRPEAVGLATAIFNADEIKNKVEDHLILVEGEFKAMILSQNGLPAIAIPGAGIFKEKWLKLFPEGKMVYVVMDPGADTQALKIAQMLGRGGLTTRLVTIPTKPDDFFTLYSGKLNQFYTFLKTGRKVIC